MIDVFRPAKCYLKKLKVAGVTLQPGRGFCSMKFFKIIAQMNSLAGKVFFQAARMPASEPTRGILADSLWSRWQRFS